MQNGIKKLSKQKHFLEDFSPSSLVRANEANLYSLSPFYHSWPGAEIHAGPELCWCITDIACPQSNVAFQAHLTSENVDKAIDHFISKGRARNVPLCWYTGIDSLPINLGEYLNKHGFVNDGECPAMAIDLLDMNDDISAPPELSIQQVTSAGSLKIWVKTTIAGFGIPARVEPELLKWCSTGESLRLPQKFYLGWMSDQPVATSMVYFAEGVAGIYFITTIPQVRKRGIGSAMTVEPLRAARRRGYRIGTLQASSMGYPVYLKIGFKEYSKIGSYMWLPD